MGRVKAMGEAKRVVYVTHMERLAKQEGFQNAVLAVLGNKFGAVPDEIVTRVRAIEDPTTINDLLIRAMRATSLGELFPTS